MTTTPIRPMQSSLAVWQENLSVFGGFSRSTRPPEAKVLVRRVKGREHTSSLRPSAFEALWSLESSTFTAQIE